MRYKILASHRTIARYASQELGASRASQVLRECPNVIPCATIFGASRIDGTFKTRKAAEQFARRMECMAAFAAGKLGRKDWESVCVVDADSD